MNEFDQYIAETSEFFLSMYGESVTYKPASGQERTITAIVYRQGPDVLLALPSGRAERLELEVHNDTDDGIASDEVNTGGDFVTVAARIGDTATDRRIVRIVSQDTAMLRLEVQ